MNKVKKIACFTLLMTLLLLCVSGCGTKKQKKQTSTTEENKTGFVPDEDEDSPVDDQMRDSNGNVFKIDIQK